MKDPRNEARTNAEHVAMNDVKGKPRTDGYPTSERSAAFKTAAHSAAQASRFDDPSYGAMAWSAKAKPLSNWEVGLRKNTRGA